MQAWLFQNSFLRVLAPAEEFVAVVGHFARRFRLQSHRLHLADAIRVEASHEVKMLRAGETSAYQAGATGPGRGG